MQLIRDDGVVTVTPTLDAEQRIADLHRIGPQIVAGDTVIRIDLAQVPMLHSPDLAQLVDLVKSVAVRGAMISLVGCNPMIRKTLSMTRLDQIMAVAA